jgi:membrane protease YdiL (CAAX protease family)
MTPLKTRPGPVEFHVMAFEPDLAASDDAAPSAAPSAPRCTTHDHVDAAGRCRTCNQPFCAQCLVTPNARGALCVDCAMVAAGIRTTRRTPIPVDPKEEAERKPDRPLVDRRERRKIRRTATRAIWVGIALQAFAGSLQLSGNLEPERAIFVALGITIGFYAIVSMMVISQVTFSDVRPQWTKGAPGVSALIGIGAGLATVGIVASVVDNPVAGITLLVSEGTGMRILLAAVIFAVCAPLVEEVLFRGLVAESMRARGPLVAAASSAALFALWHLRPPFWYFFAMGVALFALYWWRGLAASMACHAVFNGTLVLLAVLVVFGPAHDIRFRGITVRAPQTWEQVNDEASSRVDMSLSGPSGARLDIFHDTAPPGRPSADALAQLLRDGQLQFPELDLSEASVRVARYRAGPAVRTTGDFQGHGVELAIVLRGPKVWLFALTTGGSARARNDFEGILTNVTLPR